jgi:hypothetical protein
VKSGIRSEFRAPARESSVSLQDNDLFHVIQAFVLIKLHPILRQAPVRVFRVHPFRDDLLTDIGFKTVFFFEAEVLPVPVVRDRLVPKI